LPQRAFGPISSAGALEQWRLNQPELFVQKLIVARVLTASAEPWLLIKPKHDLAVAVFLLSPRNGRFYLRQWVIRINSLL
jgi:hypothetical protein